MKNIFEPQSTITIKGKLMDLSKPKIMAILNITPDSFYENSRISSVDEALITAEKFIKDGAHILDIGAYSSRPGSVDISIDEEMERLIPVVSAIVKSFPEIAISVDTFRAQVAQEAVSAGAGMINDISGGTLDQNMFKTVAELQVPYVLMHMRGTPQTMKNLTDYDAIFTEILDYFSTKISELRSLGLHDIIIDPGFGFAKTADQSFALLNQLEDFSIAGLPVLVGFSRKSLVYKTLGIEVNEALNGTTVLSTIALLKGAKILRVHDVVAARESILLVEKTTGNSLSWQ